MKENLKTGMELMGINRTPEWFQQKRDELFDLMTSVQSLSGEFSTYILFQLGESTHSFVYACITDPELLQTSIDLCTQYLLLGYLRGVVDTEDKLAVLEEAQKLITPDQDREGF